MLASGGEDLVLVVAAVLKKSSSSTDQSRRSTEYSRLTRSNIPTRSSSIIKFFLPINFQLFHNFRIVPRSRVLFCTEWQKTERRPRGDLRIWKDPNFFSWGFLAFFTLLGLSTQDSGEFLTFESGLIEFISPLFFSFFSSSSSCGSSSTLPSSQPVRTLLVNSCGENGDPVTNPPGLLFSPLRIFRLALVSSRSLHSSDLQRFHSTALSNVDDPIITTSRVVFSIIDPVSSHLIAARSPTAELHQSPPRATGGHTACARHCHFVYNFEEKKLKLESILRSHWGLASQFFTPRSPLHLRPSLETVGFLDSRVDAPLRLSQRNQIMAVKPVHFNISYTRLPSGTQPSSSPFQSQPPTV